MTQILAIQAVKPGEFVQLKENGPMWIRGPYDRSTGKFELTAFDDISRSLQRKGTVLVVVGATF